MSALSVFSRLNPCKTLQKCSGAFSGVLRRQESIDPKQETKMKNDKTRNFAAAVGCAEFTMARRERCGAFDSRWFSTALQGTMFWQVDLAMTASFSLRAHNSKETP